VVGAKKIAQLAKKWQRLASIRRKRLTITVEKEAEGCSMMVTGKGHCVMYTTDGTRFEVPLAYLGTISSESSSICLRRSLLLAVTMTGSCCHKKTALLTSSSTKQKNIVMPCHYKKT
jgi:hypothetical protein